MPHKRPDELESTYDRWPVMGELARASGTPEYLSETCGDFEVAMIDASVFDSEGAHDILATLSQAHSGSLP